MQQQQQYGRGPHVAQPSPGSRALAGAIVRVLEHRAGLALERGSPAVEHLSPQLILWVASTMRRWLSLRAAA